MLEKKKVSIIGSTGSVGSSAINVIYDNLSFFTVDCLIAQNNYKKLAEQAIKVGAKRVIIENNTYYQPLKEILTDTNIEVISGRQEIISLIKSNSCDTLVLSSSGTSSVEYFYHALKLQTNIAIANKEAIVCGGEFIQKLLKSTQSKVIPIDSEHSALYQVLALNNQDIDKIIITASGGPFLELTLQELENVTKSQALCHPTWRMGEKITIDSATLMNKALEVIEAVYLFNLPYSQIEVWIDRKSILHGGVIYKDGSFIAHFSHPSMDIPVSYGLFYPNKRKTKIKSLSLFELNELALQELDENRFKAIKLAKKVLNLGKNYPCALNAANEIAVHSFLQDKISFNKIVDVVEYTLDKITSNDIKSYEDIMSEDNQARMIATDYVNKK